MNKKLSIFFRNGSKPVPRALRMMKIANDLDYDAIFCGAIRENDSEVEGTWEGFKYFRVGEKYPLLNGKGFLTYIKFTYKFCGNLTVAPYINYTTNLRGYAL